MFDKARMRETITMTRGETPSTMTLTGRSGRNYYFYVFPWAHPLKAMGGVHGATRGTVQPEGDVLHEVLWLGETSDLSRCWEDHPAAECLTRQGANRLCVYLEQDQEKRRQAVKDLVAAYKPRCQEGKGN